MRWQRPKDSLHYCITVLHYCITLLQYCTTPDRTLANGTTTSGARGFDLQERRLSEEPASLLPHSHRKLPGTCACLPLTWPPAPPAHTARHIWRTPGPPQGPYSPPPLPLLLLWPPHCCSLLLSPSVRPSWVAEPPEWEQWGIDKGTLRTPLRLGPASLRLRPSPRMTCNRTEVQKRSGKKIST